MTGQKVVKVFCHEDTAKEEFRILNRDLRNNQIRAQFFGGIMGPVMGSLSQINYSLTAVSAGCCVCSGDLTWEGLRCSSIFPDSFPAP